MLFAHGAVDVGLNYPALELGNHLYIVVYGRDDSDDALLARYGYEALAELQPTFHSTIVPLKGSAYMADA